MSSLRLLLIILLFSIIPGQLVRVGVTSGAITVSDIASLALNVSFFSYYFWTRRQINTPTGIFVPALLFTLSATASTILALNYFSVQEVASSALFLIRLLSYFLTVIVVINIVPKKDIEKWIKITLLVGVIFALIGLVQFATFHDLSSLSPLGWDPHIFRLVSTTLDPNYSGFILTVFSSLAVAAYIFKKNKLYLLAAALFTTAVVLTFSRSSYLAYLTVMLTLGVVKSPKVFLITIVAFLVAFMAIPKLRSRVIGAFAVDDTATARILSWQKAITIFKDYPAFGIGFNTYRFAQNKYGFTPSEDLGGHSGSGVDSSFLLVATTTGIFGFTFFLVWISSILLVLQKNIKKNYLQLAVFASFIALLVHTQFVNSFMFPQTILLIWFLIGVSYVSNN